MKSWLKLDVFRRMPKPVLAIVYGVVAAALGAGGMYLALGRLARLPVTAGHAEDHGQHEGHGEADHEPEHGGVILLPAAKRVTAGIRVEPARRSDLVEIIRVTGKIALNEDRVTHLHPLVEGRVHEVHVKFGDQVKKGQVLAVVDSQQVGRAKLDLYKSQRETRLAQVNYDWRKTVYENTRALIDALREGISITEIEKKFHDRPMGEYRDQLLSAYADRFKTRADYQRLADVTGRGVVAGKQLLAATAARDAAQAKFAGDLEQICFLAERRWRGAGGTYPRSAKDHAGRPRGGLPRRHGPPAAGADDGDDRRPRLSAYGHFGRSRRRGAAAAGHGGHWRRDHVEHSDARRVAGHIPLV